jgi:ABC-2 type transport system permease protein
MAIAGKELRSFYSSPIAWVMLGLFAAIFGYFFGAALTYFAKASMAGQMGGGPQRMNVNLEMIRPLLSNTTVLILFLLPMVTMRTPEEKRSGTIEQFRHRRWGRRDHPRQVRRDGMYRDAGGDRLHEHPVHLRQRPSSRCLRYFGLILFGGGFVGLFISSLTSNQMGRRRGLRGVLLF